MFAGSPWWLLLVLIISQFPGGSRHDRHGDKLPPAVLARLGTLQPRPKFACHRATIEELRFSPDGQWLWSTDAAQSSLRWQVATGLGAAIDPMLTPQALQWFRELPGKLQRDDAGGLVLPRADLVILKGYYREPYATLPVPSEMWCFAPDGKVVLLGEKRKAEWGTHLLDTSMGQAMASVPGWPGQHAHAFSPGNRQLACFRDDGTVVVLDARTGKQLAQFHEPTARWNSGGARPALAFSPDGRLLAAWDRDHGDVVLWDWQKGREYLRIAGLEAQRDRELRVCLAFSPDGKMLAVGGLRAEDDVRLYEVATGKLRRRLHGHDLPATALAWSPDGRVLASGSHDTTILLWDVYQPRR